MIDLSFYCDLALAFAAGSLVTGLAAAIGNSLARLGVTFRTDRDVSFFDGDSPDLATTGRTRFQ